jgi:hypothetical protein
VIFNTARIWFLKKQKKTKRNRGMAALHLTFMAHLVVFEAEVSDTSHWRGLALGQILVDLVDSF